VVKFEGLVLIFLEGHVIIQPFKDERL